MISETCFLAIKEATEVHGISAPSAKRDWTHARAWLHRKFRRGNAPGPMTHHGVRSKNPFALPHCRA